ncbi:hypothetical protein DFS33DRAFT_111389 [Desarmillaria ectypa]|nr:hypothetical protein DFS33DRAFT_111389 [Desarmillaria ectypa]
MPTLLFNHPGSIQSVLRPVADYLMLHDSGPTYHTMDGAHYRDHPNPMIWNDAQGNVFSGSWRSTPFQGRDESLPSGSSYQTYSEMQMHANQYFSSFAQTLKEEDERFYATFPDARPRVSSRKWIPSSTAYGYGQPHPYSADEGTSESSSTGVHSPCGYDSHIPYVGVGVQNGMDAGISGYQDIQMAETYDSQLPVCRLPFISLKPTYRAIGCQQSASLFLR